MPYGCYGSTHRRRGRPRTRSSTEVDLGTPQLQRMRSQLGVFPTKPIESASFGPSPETFVGILTLKDFLTAPQYQVAKNFIQLSWKARKTLEYPRLRQLNWHKLSQLYGQLDPSDLPADLSPAHALTQEEIEAIDLERAHTYNHILNELKTLPRGAGLLTIDVLQADKRLESLVRLLNERSHAPGLRDLCKLKHGIEVIKTHLEEWRHPRKRERHKI